jgi:arylsulfatase A-like enzyme
LATKKPNIILILNDDMGFSDLGCYGGEMQTPNLDALATNGLRYTQFYNTARCCPSRASLLTGLYPQQADVGDMTGDDDIDGYRGDLNPNTVTIAEALKTGGYATYMSGKWHVANNVEPDGPKHSWPNQRGFDDFYGIITGAANYFQPRTLTRNNETIEPDGQDYFFTDAISDEAVRQIGEHASQRNPPAGAGGYDDAPFFQYVAYTAPHWPLHAHEEDIAKYKGRFDAGWDTLREERLERMVAMGLIDEKWKLSGRDPEVGPWDEQDDKAWEARRMEVYAAQIDRMDQGIGRIVAALKESGQFENTVIVFLADNGGCAEELGGGSESWVKQMVMRNPYIGTLETRDGREIRFGNAPEIVPGGEDTYSSYGLPWANVSNTPFRMYKHWIHEGGISTPFIVHWPEGLEAHGQLRKQAAQLPDVMATFLEIAGVDYPDSYDGKTIKPLEGFSMVPTFSNRPHARDVLFWEHHGNRGARKGDWKLVAKMNEGWELYDMHADRSELNDLAAEQPEIVAELKALYDAWAKRCGVMEFDDLRALRQPKFRAKREAERTEKKDVCNE